MGRKSSTDTIADIYQAFLEQRTWKQKELADHIGIGVPALRKRLLELEEAGVPFSHDDDMVGGHHHVVWSVPKEWFPGGVTFIDRDTPDLLRVLRTSSDKKTRERLLAHLLKTASKAPMVRQEAVITPEASADEAYLPLVMDAVDQGCALYFKYFSASGGDMQWRHASVQRVLSGPPARLLAVCHRSDTLKWFRVDAILSASLDRGTAYRTAEDSKVEAMLRASVGGFAQGEAIACAFVVKDPEHKWVAKNLPCKMAPTPLPNGEGVRFEAVTAGLLPIARFVVGLGGAARVETPELKMFVDDLARGALHEERS